MRILILGGGISGLSAAWSLRKSHPNAQITLLEKESRLGGVIQTIQREGSLFEMGPRTFAVSRSASLLRLIEEVGLKEDLLYSDPSAAKRYLWSNGSLRSMGAFIPMALMGLIREVFIPKKVMEDESIYDFVSRRMNQRIAETLFDPMTLGIYSGDIRKLSLRSCFPFLHELEQKKCSMLRSFFRSSGDNRLFTLKRGIGSLIEEMGKKLEIDIVLNCPINAVTNEGVDAGGRFWKAEQIVSALPGSVMGRLTSSWTDFPTNSIWVVSLGFTTDVLSKNGFGYLVPSKEKESLMGMVWDSAIFLREKKGYRTILTAMVRNLGDRAWAEAAAFSALKRHLNCPQNPDFIHSYLAQEAIPQFVVGYRKRFLQAQIDLKERFPSLHLVGNYIDGVSVDACIRSASNTNCNT